MGLICGMSVYAIGIQRISVFDNHLRDQVESLLPSVRAFCLEGSLQAVVNRIAVDISLGFQATLIFSKNLEFTGSAFGSVLSL